MLICACKRAVLRTLLIRAVAWSGNPELVCCINKKQFRGPFFILPATHGGHVGNWVSKPKPLNFETSYSEDKRTKFDLKQQTMLHHPLTPCVSPYTPSLAPGLTYWYVCHADAQGWLGKVAGAEQRLPTQMGSVQSSRQSPRWGSKIP